MIRPPPKSALKFVVGGLAALCAAVAFADSPAGSVAPAASTTAEASKTPPRFYGAGLDVSLGDGSGLNAVGENYRNDLSVILAPKWAAGARFFPGTRFEGLSVSGRFLITRELTGTDESSFNGTSNSGVNGGCSNVTPSGQGGQVDPTQVQYCHPAANGRRTDYSDVIVLIKNPKLYTIPVVGVDVNPSLKLIAPVSAQSQVQTLEGSVAPGVSVSRAFLSDKLHVGYGVAYTQNFHRYTAPVYDQSSSQGTATSTDGNPYDGVTGAGYSNIFADPTHVGTIGGYNVAHAFTQTLSVDYAIRDNLSVSALYLLINSTPYARSCVDTVNGSALDTCASGDAVASASGSSLSRPGGHGSQWLWLSLDWQTTDYLGLSLAWLTISPTQMPNSSYRQPFISTNYDAFTTVMLSTTVSVEKVANKLF